MWWERNKNVHVGLLDTTSGIIIRISELLQIQLILQGYMSCIRGSSEIPLLSLTHLVSAPYSGLTHGKTAHQPPHMVTMCHVTCEIYSVAIVIVTQDERRDQRPHYIVKSVNQLENQSEVWPQPCQESMERNYNDRITQQTKSLYNSDHDNINNVCVFIWNGSYDHVCVLVNTVCVWGH